MFKSEDKSMTRAQWDWADIMGWGLAMDSGYHWEKKHWQKTASREQEWDRGEMRQEAKWASVEVWACETVEECHFFVVLFSIIRHTLSIPQVLKFIIAKPPSPLPLFLHPLSLRFPMSPADNLYLYTHQGLWHRVSSATLSTVISKWRGCQTVYYY